MDHVGQRAAYSVYPMPNRLYRSIQQLGWLNAVLYALGRLLAYATRGRWALYKYQFVAQAVLPGSLCQGRGQAIEVRLCRAPGALPAGCPRPAAVLAERYRQGAVCLAALRGGELAGYLWLLRGACQEDEVRARYLLPARQSAWDLDVWVRPEERLGLTFARLWEEASRLLHAQDVRWTCSRISAFNPVSLGAHARIGTRRLGSATFLRCGRWQWMIATLAPYCHLSRRAAAFPSLSFDTTRLADLPRKELPCRISKP